MPETPVSVPLPNAAVDAQYGLQRFREAITAIIALAVLITSGLLIKAALEYADNFERAKDILMIVNPIVGIVIGFYFNKTTSDNQTVRAEAAAIQAGADKEIAEQKNETIKSSLQELIRSVESHPAVKQGPRFVDQADAAPADRDLASSMERARLVLDL